MIKRKHKNSSHAKAAALAYVISIVLSIALFMHDDSRSWWEVLTLWIVPTGALLYLLYYFRPTRTDKLGIILYTICGLAGIALITVVVTFFVVLAGISACRFC